MKKHALHFAFIAVLLSVFVSSCSNFRYTNYGRPLDFLHAKKYKAQPVAQEKESNTTEVSTSDEVQTVAVETENKPSESVAKVEEKSTLVTKESTKRVETQTEAIKTNSASNEVAVNDTEIITKTVEETSETSSKKEVRKAVKHSVKSLSNTTATSSDDLLIILLCILIPPLAVFLVLGFGKEFWIDLILTLVGFWIVGIIYALIVCL